VTTFLVACTPASSATPFYGLAQAKDGDSLQVGNREVRLFGIDAPEWDQSCTRAGKQWACGQEAAEQLSKLVTGRDVRCIAVDTDKHGRTVARCTVGTTDVNRTMVATGYATAYRRYSMDYVSAEQSAKANKRGIWSGTFEMPSEVRHEAEERGAETVRTGRAPRAPSLRAEPDASGGCTIKGNRGSNGWIYHVPGMPYYARTNAEEMFCSEADAKAAGYRRARVR
jgi:endonuclease YncB( thermonuclease family)